MREVVIYVEGPGDLILITHLLDFHFQINLKVDDSQLSGDVNENGLKLVVRVFDVDSGNGGIDSRKIRELVEEIKRTNIPLGIKSALIIDTDTPDHSNPKGGFAHRKNYLNDLCDGTDISYFLVPNNQDDGNLETLLDEIVSANGLPYYRCLQGFITCLAILKGEQIPPKLVGKHWEKTKLEWYAFNMDGSNSRNPVRNYQDGDLWDLNAISLNPLREFLAQIIAHEAL